MLGGKSVWLSGMVLIGAFAVVCVVVYMEVFRDPEFRVTNHTNQVVNVVAYWKDYNKNLGAVGPKESVEFSVQDEAAMSFRVRYSDDREVLSEEIYFTSGLGDIDVGVFSEKIDINYAQ